MTNDNVQVERFLREFYIPWITEQKKRGILPAMPNIDKQREQYQMVGQEKQFFPEYLPEYKNFSQGIPFNSYMQPQTNVSTDWAGFFEKMRQQQQQPQQEM